MKITVSIRLLALALVLLAAITALPRRAHAAFTLTLSQVGANVVVNGSGTLNTSGLFLLTSNTTGAGINPGSALLVAGPASSTNFVVYNGGGLTGPTAIGIGNGAPASSGTGSLVGVYGISSYLFVPQGYISGTPLTDTATYTGKTFATLGFVPGTYTYTWGTGATADSLTITSVVPEPSTWALLSVGAASAGVVALRRRRTVA